MTTVERELTAPAEWKGLQGIFCEPWTHYDRETGESRDDEWPGRYGGWLEFAPEIARMNRTERIWFVPRHLQGSDYSGGFVCKANFEAFCEQFSEGEDDWYCTVTGGHGTYAVVIDIRKAPREAYDVLCALEDYPCIDEERVSRLEQKAADEAWDSWARADFRKALEKRFQVELDDESETNERLEYLFHEARDTANEYWEPQGDTPDVWIDVERVAKHVDLDDLTDFIVDESEDT